ncbi:MAG TPA: carbon storage regulator [Dehalococcoidia bacterium]|nr:carbon storage regulator [Dehalococcoidia bacterium]
MLILTRKVDQGIVISGNILVRVLGVERDRVKIGISAPGEVTVLRQELLEREQQRKEAEAAEQAEKPSDEEEARSGEASSGGAMSGAA